MEGLSRTQKKLFQLTGQCADLLEAYVSTESSGYNALVTLFNVTERLNTLQPACLGPFQCVELLGPLTAFDGVALKVVQALQHDTPRLRSRIVGYFETLQAVHDKLSDVNWKSQLLVLQASGTSPISVESLSARSIDEPHSALSLAAYSDTWVACLAADLAHKSAIIAALPGDTFDSVAFLESQPDEAAETLRRIEACCASWVPRSTTSALSLRDSLPSNASVGGAPLLSPSSYLVHLWEEASLDFWRFRGRDLPSPALLPPAAQQNQTHSQARPALAIRGDLKSPAATPM